MYSVILLAVVACLLSAVLTPLLRDCSLRWGIVDRPDCFRKLHKVATPRIGGVPILLSYGGAYAVLLLLPLRSGGMIESHLATIWRLLPPVALVFMAGLVDDWLDLKPWQKLVAEVVAAAWIYAAGVRILGVTGHALAPWCSFVLTVGWLVLCANSFNLIDGIDGLAAGLGLTATMTIFIAGMLHGDVMLGLATAPLAGCLVGFLRYNFNPASIFLGDSGSLLIGFLLGTYGIVWSQKSATMLGVAAPAMALALPLLEVVLSVVRRFLRNEPIFQGDRGHIHHRLLDRGFTPRRVALLLYGVGGVVAALSLVQSVLQNRFGGMIVVLFGVSTCVGVHYLRYAELRATGRFLWAGLRPLLSAQVQLELLERKLRNAGHVDQCWSAIALTARSLGYSHVRARLGGRRFETDPLDAGRPRFWQTRLKLGERDYIAITQRGGAIGPPCATVAYRQPLLVAPFLEVVGRVLPRRLEELEELERGAASLANLAKAVGNSRGRYASGLNSSTTSVMSSDCAAPSVKTATAS